MTDMTPAPAQQDPGIQTLSVEQILEMQNKLRENRAAQLKGEPLPHTVSPEEMKAAIQAIRRQRGTLNLADGRGTAAKRGKKGGGTIEILDLDGI